MPKNRMNVHDSRDELPPVIIEALNGDILRFTQIDSDGHTHVVTLSAQHVVRHGVFGSKDPAEDIGRSELQ